MSELFKILIRCDGGGKAGIGHLSRCSVLADSIKKNRGAVHFIIKSDSPSFVKYFLSHKGFNNNLDFIPPDLSIVSDAKETVKFYKKLDADFLIVDHYNAFPEYQKIIKLNECKWAQFDYKANFNLYSQIVINNDASVKKEDYNDLVGIDTVLFLGPRYSLIGNEFIQNKNLRNTVGNEDKFEILMMFGAGYNKNLFIQVKYYLEYSMREATKHYHWVTTSNNYELNGLIENCKNDPKVSLYINSSWLPLLIKNADVIITSGGYSTNEIAYLKKPMIIYSIVENQIKQAEAWEKVGIAKHIKSIEDFKKIDKIFLKKLFRSANNIYKKKDIITGNGADIITNFVIDKYINK